jgi:DNA-binding CsgD family transcriptional regulator
MLWPGVEPDVNKGLYDRDPYALTKREQDVLDAILRGELGKLTAFRLGLSEKTIKHYKSALYQKLRVRNANECILQAAKHGLLPDQKAPEPDKEVDSPGWPFHGTSALIIYRPMPVGYTRA